MVADAISVTPLAKRHTEFEKTFGMHAPHFSHSVAANVDQGDAFRLRLKRPHDTHIADMMYAQHGERIAMATLYQRFEIISDEDEPELARKV